MHGADNLPNLIASMSSGNIVIDYDFDFGEHTVRMVGKLNDQAVVACFRECFDTPLQPFGKMNISESSGVALNVKRS